MLASALAILLALDGAAARAGGKPGYPDTIVWAGRTWHVKSSRSAVGPGPNLFSASPANVWIDGEGQLHLRITNRGGIWYCAEIIGADSLGYGAYEFVLESPVDALDANVVLGLFTWSDRAQYNHREIDVEFARWGNAADPANAQYVVQPYDRAGNLVRFTEPAAPWSTHVFTWRPGAVDFASTSTAGSNGWMYNGSDVPKPGGETVRLNLWLFQGQPPTDGQEVEVVVRRFTFLPGT